MLCWQVIQKATGWKHSGSHLRVVRSSRKDPEGREAPVLHHCIATPSKLKWHKTTTMILSSQSLWVRNSEGYSCLRSTVPGSTVSDNWGVLNWGQNHVETSALISCYLGWDDSKAGLSWDCWPKQLYLYLYIDICICIIYIYRSVYLFTYMSISISISSTSIYLASL